MTVRDQSEKKKFGWVTKEIFSKIQWPKCWTKQNSMTKVIIFLFLWILGATLVQWRTQFWNASLYNPQLEIIFSSFSIIQEIQLCQTNVLWCIHYQILLRWNFSHRKRSITKYFNNEILIFYRLHQWESVFVAWMVQFSNEKFKNLCI